MCLKKSSSDKGLALQESTCTAKYEQYSFGSSNFSESFGYATKVVARIILVIICVAAMGNILNAQTFNLQKSVTNQNPNAGQPFSYIIDASCNSTTTDCESAVIVDCLPPEVEFMSLSDPQPDGVFAVYDSGTHCVTITFDATACGSCTPDGINTDNNDFAQGSTIQLAIQVRFPAGSFSGTTADNTATGTSDNAGNPSDSAPQVTVNGSASQVGCDAIPAEVNGLYQILANGTWQGRAIPANYGNTDATNYVIETTLPTNIEFTYIRGIDHQGGYCHDIDVYYETTASPGTFSLWTTINSCDDDFLYATSLGLAPGEKVSAFRYDFGNLTGNGAWNPSTWLAPYSHHIKMFGIADASLSAGSTVIYCNTVSGNIGASNCLDNNCETTEVTAGNNVVNGFKDIQDDAGNENYNWTVGETQTVTLGFASVESMNTDILGGYLLDILPPCMEYVPGTWNIPWGHSNADNLDPVVNVGNMPDGRQYVEFIWAAALGNEFVMESDGAWQGFAVEFDVFISGSCTEGTYTNEYYFATTGNDSNTNCWSYDEVTNLNNFGSASSYVSQGNLCYEPREFEVILPPGSAGLESYKEVQGTLDTDYSKFPATGETVPGGLNDYRICLSNPNATPVDDIVVIDIFPNPGDTEVLDPSVPRGSAWQPILSSVIIPPAGISVEYTTVTNPCRNELAGPSDPTPFPSGCISPNWSSTPPSDLTTVTAVRFDFGSTTLNLGDEICIEWSMRAPIITATNTTAWNSFAYVGSNATTGTPLLPAEPIKVGIELVPGSIPIKGDFVWNDLNGNGLQDAGEPGIDGVTVNLYEDSDGDGVPEPGSDQLYTHTITQGGGNYIFSDFPVGSYFIEFTNLPSGFNPTHTNVGVNEAIDSDGLIIGVFTVTNTTDNRDCDLGLILGDPPTLCICEGCPDKDEDGIWDILDKDSDNDGILNVDEGFECETVDLSSYATGDALSNFNSAGITIGGSLMQVEIPLQFGGSATLDEYAISDRHNGIDHGLLLGVKNSFGTSDYLSATYTFSTPVCGFNGTILDVDRTDAVQIIGRNGGTVVPLTITTLGANLFFDGVNEVSSIFNGNAEPPNTSAVNNHSFGFKLNDCVDEIEIIIYDYNGAGGGSYTFIVSPDPSCAGTDCDLDGVPDFLDLDSDNDGIPDAIEVCGNINLNLNNCMLVDNGIATQNDIDGDGCPDGVVSSCTPQDEDGDGIPNFKDLDSDNDGCSDANEGGTSDNPYVNNSIINQGYANPAAAVNECGLVLNIIAECHTPSGTEWLDAGQKEGCCELAMEITNINVLECEGDANGQVDLNAINGAGPFQYTVPGEGTNSTGQFNNLLAGFYPVTITDNDGCEFNGGFYIQHESCDGPFAQLEMHNGSGNPTGNGPTTGSQTVTYSQNTNDPTGNSTSNYTPNITSTFSFQSQQYTSIDCSGTGAGMVFGGRTNSGACNHIPTEIYGPFIPSDPTNDMFTSFPTNSPGTGIDMASNYGIRIHNSINGLSEAELPVNASHYMGELTINFNTPVDDPVIHLAGLGGFRGGIGFTSDYELVTSGVTLHELSGNQNFDVSGNMIQNSSINPNSESNSGAASGSVVAAGKDISALTFKVYIRGTLNTIYNNTAVNQQGDALTISLSFQEGEPVNCCKVIYQNGFIRTNSKFN